MLVESKANHEADTGQVERVSMRDLPDDTLHLIFRFLPLMDMKWSDMFRSVNHAKLYVDGYHCAESRRIAKGSYFNQHARVNKQWHEVAMDRVFWRAQFQHDYPELQHTWFRKQRLLYSPRVFESFTDHLVVTLPTDPHFNWAKTYARAWRLEMRKYRDECYLRPLYDDQHCYQIKWPEFIKRGDFETYQRHAQHPPYKKLRDSDAINLDDSLNTFVHLSDLISLMTHYKDQRFLDLHWKNALAHHSSHRPGHEKIGVSHAEFKNSLNPGPNNLPQDILKLNSIYDLTITAVVTNQLDVVRKLINRLKGENKLDQPLSLNRYSRPLLRKHIATPLIGIAAKYNHTHLVALCLDAGADINARAMVNGRYQLTRTRTLENEPHHTALHYAVESGHSEIIKYLLQQPGINPNIPSYGFTESELTGRLWLNPKTPIPGDNTPLHFAAKKGRLLVVQLLLASASVAVDRRNNEGLLAFDIAVNQGSIEIARAIFGRMSGDFLLGLSKDDPLHHPAVSLKTINDVLTQFCEYLLPNTPDEHYRSLQFLLPLKDYWETYRRKHCSARKHPPEDKTRALFFLMSAASEEDLAVRRDFIQKMRPDLLHSRFSGSLHHAVEDAMTELPQPVHSAHRKKPFIANTGLTIEIIEEKKASPATENHETHQPSLADLLADSDESDDESEEIRARVSTTPPTKKALFDTHLDRAQRYYYRNKNQCLASLSTHGTKGRQGVTHYQTTIREAYDNPAVSQEDFATFLTQETLAFLQGLESQAQQDGQPYHYPSTTFSKSMSRFTDFKDLMINGLPYQDRLKELFSCKRFVNGPWGKFFRGLFLLISVLALTAVIVSATCGTGSIPIICVALQYADMLSKAFGLAISCALAVSPNALSCMGYFAGNSTKPRFQVMAQKSDAINVPINHALT